MNTGSPIHSLTNSPTVTSSQIMPPRPNSPRTPPFATTSLSYLTRPPYSPRPPHPIPFQPTPNTTSPTHSLQPSWHSSDDMARKENAPAFTRKPERPTQCQCITKPNGPAHPYLCSSFFVRGAPGPRALATLSMPPPPPRSSRPLRPRSKKCFVSPNTPFMKRGRAPLAP